jgi:hypothetical protein
MAALGVVLVRDGWVWKLVRIMDALRSGIRAGDVAVSESAVAGLIRP